MGTYGATWEAAGYAGAGSVASLINSLLGQPAVVVGGARGVFEDYDRVLAHYRGGIVVFAANDVGMYLPRLDHWCSLHTDNLGLWKPVRWMHAHAQENTKYHSTDPRPFIDYVWEGLRPLFCLSGLFAMQLAWIMGASPIILVGCPMDATPRFFESKIKPGQFAYGGGAQGADFSVREQVMKEMMRLPEFCEAVRSMSGWSREYFGTPKGIQ